MILSLFFAACTPIENPAPEAVLDAQLEAMSVTSTAATGEGDLALSGDDADFTLTAGDASFTVHSPAHSALDAWAGEAVTVSTQGAGDVEFGYDLSGVEVTDADGLVWLAEPGIGSVFAETRFGADFATYGAELGQEERGNYIVSLFSVVFQTDDGEVEASAGEPATVTLGGLDYRATVITAYTAEEAPGAPQYDCMGKPDILSYELVRVTEPSAWEPLLRPAAKPTANVAGCGEE